MGLTPVERAMNAVRSDCAFIVLICPDEHDCVFIAFIGADFSDGAFIPLIRPGAPGGALILFTASRRQG